MENTESGVKFLKTYEDKENNATYNFVELTTRQALDLEGNALGFENDTLGYSLQSSDRMENGVLRLFSLRDKENKPLLIIESKSREDGPQKFNRILDENTEKTTSGLPRHGSIDIEKLGKYHEVLRKLLREEIQLDSSFYDIAPCLMLRAERKEVAYYSLKEDQKKKLFDTPDGVFLVDGNYCRNNTPNAQFKKILKNMPETALDLKAEPVLFDLLKYSKTKESLGELKAISCIIDNEGIKTISKMPNLSSLNVACNNLGHEEAKVISKMTNLRELTVYRNNIGDEGAKAIASMSNLTSLDIRENNIGQEGVSEFSGLINLAHLNINYNNIGSEGAKAISKISSLISLDIRKNNIGDEGAKALAEMTNLASLSLENNNVGDEAAKALSKMTNLISLDICDNNIGDEGAIALSKMTNLSNLSIYGNNIGDEGAIAFSKMTNLTSLAIENNNMSEDSKEQFIKNIEKNHNLLSFDGFSDKKIEEYLARNKEEAKTVISQLIFSSEESTEKLTAEDILPRKNAIMKVLTDSIKSEQKRTQFMQILDNAIGHPREKVVNFNFSQIYNGHTRR